MLVKLVLYADGEMLMIHVQMHCAVCRSTFATYRTISTIRGNKLQCIDICMRDVDLYTQLLRYRSLRVTFDSNLTSDLDMIAFVSIVYYVCIIIQSALNVCIQFMNWTSGVDVYMQSAQYYATNDATIQNICVILVS